MKKSRPKRHKRKRTDSRALQHREQLWRDELCKEIAPKLGYDPSVITDEHLSDSDNGRSHLVEAFTHRTFAHEMRQSAPDRRILDNQRLEFLGDSILGYIATINIYRLAPQLSEGELSATRATLINRNTLRDIAIQEGFELHLRLGRGEPNMGEAARSARLADLTEAVIGAMYLDLGIEHTSRWLWTLLEPFLKLDDAGQGLKHDPKTELQHWAHRMHKLTPTYETKENTIKNKPETLTFHSQVFLGDTLLGEGEGMTKRVAEREAAKSAFKNISLSDS